MRNIVTAGILWLLSCTITYADWRQDVGTLRIGVVADSNNALLIVQAEPFRLAIQEALNIPVEIFAARDYPSLVRAHSDGRVEYAILSASAYAAVYVICECVEPSVVATSDDGTTSYNSIVITRNKDGINSVKDLKGKHLIALSKDSIAGYSYPLFELVKGGVNLKDKGGSLSFGTEFEPAVKQFAEGKGDALLGWSSMQGEKTAGYSRGSLKDLSSIKGMSLNDFKVIWQSSNISHNVHSIRKNLPGEAKTILRELLSKMHVEDPVAYDSIEPYFGGGFTIARQTMFAPMIEFAKSPLLGIEKLGIAKMENNKGK